MQMPSGPASAAPETVSFYSLKLSFSSSSKGQAIRRWLPSNPLTVRPHAYSGLMIFAGDGHREIHLGHRDKDKCLQESAEYRKRDERQWQQRSGNAKKDNDQ